MPARWVDNAFTTKSNSTGTIAAHSSKKRKDGGTPVGMVHAKIVKGGHSPFALYSSSRNSQSASGAGSLARDR
jgi:hypothetical protein